MSDDLHNQQGNQQPVPQGTPGSASSPVPPVQQPNDITDLEKEAERLSQELAKLTNAISVKQKEAAEQALNITKQALPNQVVTPQDAQPPAPAAAPPLATLPPTPSPSPSPSENLTPQNQQNHSDLTSYLT